MVANPLRYGIVHRVKRPSRVGRKGTQSSDKAPKDVNIGKWGVVTGGLPLNKLLEVPFMGTNYYSADGTHIGKRSGAGLYCYNCKCTLCEGGEKDIHRGQSLFLDHCPVCGRDHTSSSIRAVTSFTWACEQSDLLRKRVIVDEYGDKTSMLSFLENVVDKCPIHFYHMIGSGMEWE